MPGSIKADDKCKPPRIVERLSREHQQNRSNNMTNDYLEGWVDENDMIVGEGASALQRLDEQAQRRVYSNWCNIVEERHVRKAEAAFFAAKLFDSCDEDASDREAHLSMVRANLHQQFEESFRFDAERRQLSAKVNNKEDAFDSSITLQDFVAVMWDPLIETGVFNEAGMRLRAPAALQAAKVIQLLAGGISRSKPVTTGSDLNDYINDIFTSIDNTQHESISWGQFVSYMIERVYMHSLEGKGNQAQRIDSRASSTAANGSIIYRDSFAVTFPQHRQHWIHKTAYFAQGGWDSVVALNGRHAMVSLVEDFDQQQGVSDGDAYAAMCEANDEFASHKKEQLQELLRVSCAAHIAKGVHYFAHEGIVNSCEWISKERLFLTVATEQKQLRFWSVHNRSEFRFLNHLRLSVPDDSAVTSVRIDEKRLLSADTIKVMFGSRGGYVLTGDIVDADQIKKCHNFTTSTVKLHNDAVTDMLVLPRSQRVVSCGLDGRIFGFAPGVDVTRNATEYVGHKRGVLSMAYCSGYELFVSGGFEYSALCWAENLPRSPAFRLEDVVQPHQYPICSVLAVPRTPNVYTVDTTGVIKVFDVRMLKALGSWGAFDVGRVPTHIIHDITLGEPSFDGTFHSDRLVASACYTGSKHRSIIVSARGMHRFTTESRNGDADRPLDLADPILTVCLGTTTILTAAASVVRVWLISTGRVLATHRTVRYTPSSVSAAAIDDPGAKIVTGHADGQINVFQRDSGVVLRRYRFHDGRISFIALDIMHGVMISSCCRGQLAFWRDRDCASSHKGRYGHCNAIQQPVEKYFYRLFNDLPQDVQQLVDFPSDLVRGVALRRWVINRWTAHAASEKARRLGSQQTEDAVRPIRVPSFFANMVYPGRSCSLSSATARIAVLSGKTMCRIFDYTVMPAVATHALYHGLDRPLLCSSLHPSKNVVAVSDAHGMVFLWLLPPNSSAVLLSTVLNKCLVSSYSHPHEEFRDVDEDVDEAANTQPGLERQDGLRVESTLPPYKPPTTAVPAVTSLFVDPVRYIVITGDDVGFVSLWEIEPVFCGSCDVYEALQESEESGRPPRWVHAWRAHPLPVTAVRAVQHATYAIMTVGADNMVSLWTIGGDWLAGLRQGPVVDRTWMFPYPLLNQGALIRYRFEKLLQAFREGELARLRRIRDGEELERPPVHPELLAKLFGWAKSEGDTRQQITRVVEPTPALQRHVGFIQRKRFSVSLRARGLRWSVPRRSVSTAQQVLDQSMQPISDSDSNDTDAQFGLVVEETRGAGRTLVDSTGQSRPNKLIIGPGLVVEQARRVSPPRRKELVAHPRLSVEPLKANVLQDPRPLPRAGCSSAQPLKRNVKADSLDSRDRDAGRAAIHARYTPPTRVLPPPVASGSVALGGCASTELRVVSRLSDNRRTSDEPSVRSRSASTEPRIMRAPKRPLPPLGNVVWSSPLTAESAETTRFPTTNIVLGRAVNSAIPRIRRPSSNLVRGLPQTPSTPVLK